jgi:structural maintenance of chromosome 2
MLEETAGTSLYNKKKSDCVSLMQRKEDKIKEINELIN